VILLIAGSAFLFKLEPFGFPLSVTLFTLAIFDDIKDGTDDPKNCQSKVKAEKKGTTIIYARVKGRTLTCVVRVQ